MAATTLPAQLRYVEDAHDTLGLTYRQIAAALGADESTLHRWRAGDTDPRSIFLRRMEALREMQQELLNAMPADAAREWLRTDNGALAGRSPAACLEEGRIEPVTRLLLRLNLGTST